MSRRRFVLLLIVLAATLAGPAGTAFAGLPARGELLISEVRFDGPGGAHDGYVELTNPTDLGQTVQGMALVFDTSDGPQQVALPHITVVPGGSVLVADAGYTLGGVAAPDVQTALTGTVRGVRLGAGDGTSVTDRVGLTTAGSGFREGAGLTHPAVATESVYARRVVGGGYVQQGDNAADFRLVSTDPASAGLAPPATLGAPGPAGNDDPVRVDALVARRVLDPAAPADGAPNQSEDPATATITVRVHLSNRSRAVVHSLRLRVTDLSTAGAAAGSPGAHLVSAPDETVIVGGTPVTVHGTTLEQPPAQPSGGGINSALDVPLPAAGLAPGASVDAAVRVARDAPGTLQLAYRLEGGIGRVPTVTESPAQAAPGARLLVRGAGWTPGHNIAVRIGPAPCVLAANPLGNISSDTACAVPPGTPAGSLAVTATDNDDPSATASTLDVQIVPKIAALSATGGVTGASIDLGVAGFHASTPLHVSVGGVDATTVPATPHTDADGDATLSFRVPPGLPSGATELRVSDGTLAVTHAFTAAGATIDISPRTATNDARLEVTGGGWKPGGTVNLRLDGSIVCTFKPDASGAISSAASGPCVVPPVPGFPAGGHHATADEDGLAGSVDGGTITIEPFVDGYSVSLQAATKHLVSVTGFKANASLAVTVGGVDARTDPAPITTDVHGSAKGFFWVPQSTPAGTATLTVSDGTNLASTTFTATAAPTIVASPASGKEGDAITFTGEHWPSSTVTIKIGGVAICRATRSLDPPSFSKVCHLPAGLPTGSQPLTAEGTYEEVVTGDPFTVQPSSPLAADGRPSESQVSAAPIVAAGATAPTAAPSVPRAARRAALVDLPAARRCGSWPALRIRLHATQARTPVRATIRVDGRRVATVRGTRLRAAVVVRRLPARRVVVTVSVRYAGGAVVKRTRTYAAC